MKTRIEVSCTEDNLAISLHEVRAILDAAKLESIELKVFHDINRDPSKGHSYVTVSRHSFPTDLLDNYFLKKRLREIENKTPEPPKN